MDDPTTMKSAEPMWGTLGTQGYDERPLCPHCIHPLRPDAHFCKRCVAPVSSYASFGAFGDGNYEAIWSTAWILGQALTTPEPRLLHAWGVTLIFGPAVVGTLAFAQGGVYEMPGMLVAAALLCIQVAFLWRVWLRQSPDADSPFG